MSCMGADNLSLLAAPRPAFLFIRIASHLNRLFFYKLEGPGMKAAPLVLFVAIAYSTPSGKGCRPER
jgi:hypothetical protein